MRLLRKEKGFTLIEMLIVVAIIAILVAVIVPTASSSAVKARAATDAANLRNSFESLNASVFGLQMDPSEIFARYNTPKCVSYKDAVLKAYYVYPAVFEIYYVSGENYYSVDFFRQLAADGRATVATSNPHPGLEGWYLVGNVED